MHSVPSNMNYQIPVKLEKIWAKCENNVVESLELLDKNLFVRFRTHLRIPRKFDKIN